MILRNHAGSSLAIVLMVTILLSGLAVTLATTAVNARQSGERNSDGNQARYTARAGFERACAQVLDTSADWNTLGPSDAWSAVTFTAGTSYDLQYLTTGSGDSVRVQVDAHVHSSDWRLLFTAVRSSFGQPITLRAIEDYALQRWLGERLADS
jgi:type II secretory pathway component PulK